MKTKEELLSLKNRVEELRSELMELTDEELRQVTGGIGGGIIFTPTDDVSEDVEQNIK